MIVRAMLVSALCLLPPAVHAAARLAYVFIPTCAFLLATAPAASVSRAV